MKNTGRLLGGVGVKRIGYLFATGLICSACAPQGGSVQQAQAPQPTPAVAPKPAQPSYNLNGGSMVVVTEPSPGVRRTTAALDLVASKTLLDVARQASIRVAKADASGSSVINAVAAPTTDVALRIEQVLLGRLGNVFSLAVKVNQVGNPSRAFPFNAAGAQELAGKLNAAGLKGYALDARTEFLDLETSGGTINDPVERFSLNGQVKARLVDISDGRVLRQAVCTDNQQMGTLRDIFVAEGRPVPESAALAAVSAPAPAPASEQPAAQSDGPRPASDTSAAALALIQKTDQAEKSQRLVEPTAPTEPLETAEPVTEPAAVASQVPQASTVATTAPEVQPTTSERVAREAVAAVTAPAQPVAAPTAPAQPVAASVSEPEPTEPAQPAASITQPAAPETPAPQPTEQERVQAALQQAAPTRSEVAAQATAEQAARERPREIPIRRTGAFSGVVQSAIEETPDDQLIRRQRTVTVETSGVKQKARLGAASLLLAQATAPITLPGPGASGRVSDGAAERLIRKCAEDLWQKIVPE